MPALAEHGGAVGHLLLSGEHEVLGRFGELAGVHAVGFQRVADQLFALHAVAGMQGVGQGDDRAEQGQGKDQRAEVEAGGQRAHAVHGQQGAAPTGTRGWNGSSEAVRSARHSAEPVRVPRPPFDDPAPGRSTTLWAAIIADYTPTWVKWAPRWRPSAFQAPAQYAAQVIGAGLVQWSEHTAYGLGDVRGGVLIGLEDVMLEHGLPVRALRRR